MYVNKVLLRAFNWKHHPNDILTYDTVTSHSNSQRYKHSITDNNVIKMLLMTFLFFINLK